MQISFTSDPEKAKRNLRKHGITFEEGQQVFDDPFLIVLEDREDEYGEMTYHALGRVQSQMLIVLIHADRSTDKQEIIHIISARKADDYEQRAYSHQF